MYEDPEENPSESASDPKSRAKEKADEFRMHAEVAAVFEGPRKFEARLIPHFDATVARTLQRTLAKLDRSKKPESPVLPDESTTDAHDLLNFPKTHDLSTNDYHIHRRPGEVMIARWLAGDEVDTFYNRLQAHFDVGFDGFREDERTSQQWKQDPATLAYLESLDAVPLKMTEVYLRDVIRQHRIFVLSTQTFDEMNIAYLADHVMSVPIEDLVGSASAPPEAPTERDLAWFYKLFSLRGMVDGEERICLFTFLQKSDDGF